MILREPVTTVGFIDEYCLHYRSGLDDVRSYECFKWLHVDLLSPLPHKTLPEIAKLNGLKDGQSLHHFCGMQCGMSHKCKPSACR